MSDAKGLLISAVCSSIFATLAPLASAWAQSDCVYADEHGAFVSARVLKDIPARFRSKAVCRDRQPVTVPAADEITIQGGSRSASFGTPLGTVEVKWPRQVEQCFERSPARAISEASSAVNRALRTARFDQSIQAKRRDWSFVLIDRASALSQFPMQLSLGGHPGFMVPPNQIYIVTDYISPNCEKGGDSDALLTQVLLHEMGHVLEYALLGEEGFNGDRKRAEGFAAWFEGYSANYAATVPKGRVQERYHGMVQSDATVGSSSFTGSGEDYAIASLEFEAIVARKGVAGLMDVYETMGKSHCSFYEALNKRFGWDQKDLQREVKSLRGS
jgi:hypothetical protein